MKETVFPLTLNRAFNPGPIPAAMYTLLGSPELLSGAGGAAAASPAAGTPCGWPSAATAGATALAARKTASKAVRTEAFMSSSSCAGPGAPAPHRASSLFGCERGSLDALPHHVVAGPAGG